MLIREETKSDQIHFGDGPRKNSSSTGKAEEGGHGLPPRVTFQTIPWKMMSVKKEQDKGKL